MPRSSTGEIIRPRSFPEIGAIPRSDDDPGRTCNIAPYAAKIGLSPFRRPALDETVIIEYAPLTIGVVDPIGVPAPADPPTEIVSLLAALGGTKAHMRPGRGRHRRAGRLQLLATAIRKAVTR